MHTALTPWKTYRLAIFGTIVSIGLFFAAILSPFYSYTYLFQGNTMTFVQIVQANSTILIPFIGLILSIVCLIASLIIMMVWPNLKVTQTIASVLTFISAFISLAVLIISLARLWILPYDFAYSAAQELLVGYVIYIIFALYHGFLSCYVLAINGGK
ncbi:MAG: hypothetical protein GXY57_01055 [Erysipelotrichaceae bacterium]|jgi:hypothetical protein|nr:hypothetical protein [Erysipelotrichaceae bacterium]